MKISHLRSIGLLSALVTTAFLVQTTFAFGASDSLGKQRVKIETTQSEAALQKTIGNLRGVFQNFRPGVDSATRVLSGPSVSGSSTHPYLKVSMERCVLLMCKTVDLDADITLQETKGTCKKNLLIQADLSRSSDTLSSVYDRLDFAICYNSAQDGRGAIEFTAAAHRAPSFDAGIVQAEVLTVIQLQVAPIARALQLALEANSK